MKKYSFTFLDEIKNKKTLIVKAKTKEEAYDSLIMDTRFKGCRILKSSMKLVKN